MWNELYFATRYHDPHIFNKVIEECGKGLTLHILDGNPEQIGVENRLAAIIRTPPNRESAQLARSVLKSPRFDLKRLATLPVSFMIVDGIQVVYETVNYVNLDNLLLLFVSTMTRTWLSDLLNTSNFWHKMLQFPSFFRFQEKITGISSKDPQTKSMVSKNSL